MLNMLINKINYIAHYYFMLSIVLTNVNKLNNFIVNVILSVIYCNHLVNSHKSYKVYICTCYI